MKTELFGVHYFISPFPDQMFLSILCGPAVCFVSNSCRLIFRKVFVCYSWGMINVLAMRQLSWPEAMMLFVFGSNVRFRFLK